MKLIIGIQLGGSTKAYDADEKNKRDIEEEEAAS